MSLLSFCNQTRKWVCLGVSVIVLFSILRRRPLGDVHDYPTANETFALLIFSIILWIGNPIPTYVTALLAPILAVMLRVLISETGGKVEILQRGQAADLVLKFMMNRIVAILLGGFTLARALNRALEGNSYFAMLYIKHATKGGRVISWMLFGLILTPMYLSALIPHEAATMIAYDLLAPIIQSLPANSDLAKVTLLALMLGGNLGGMLSSISTPQNILLFSADQGVGFRLTWSMWASTSWPITLLSAVLCWLGLLVMWRPWKLSLPADIQSQVAVFSSSDVERGSSNKKSENHEITKDTSKEDHHKPEHESDIMPLKLKLSKLDDEQQMTPLKRYLTFVIALFTVILWLSARYVEDYTGGLGLVSFFPIVSLYALGVLNRKDLSLLPWDIVLLAMGATTLSSICKNSGLFNLLEGEFEPLLRPFNGWMRVVLLCAMMTFSGAVKSRYIAALVYLPLAFRAIGSTAHTNTTENFQTGQKILAAFACSAGMLLPFSGLVNIFVSDIKQAHEPGHKYIRTREFVMAGALGTMVSLFIIVTLGYGIIKTF